MTLVFFEVFCQETYHGFIAQGLRFQKQVDSLQRLIEAQTLSLSTVAASRRGAIMNSIRDNDLLAVALQKQAHEMFEQAERVMTTITSAVDDTVSDVKLLEEPQFAILSQSPYSEANPIPLDEPLPDGVLYKIQLGAFSRVMPANSFKGLTPV